MDRILDYVSFDEDIKSKCRRFDFRSYRASHGLIKP